METDVQTTTTTRRAELLHLLQAVQSNQRHVREAAEASLAEHESNETAGYLLELVSIATQNQNDVPEDVRLLALIVAKNVVGSSWTKQVRSREWKRLPEGEKGPIRNALLSHILAREDSERICTQASLLVANIAQFDYPDKWPTLLDDLLRLSMPSGGLPCERRHRPLKTIKYVARVLEKKRFVLEEPSGMPLMTLSPDRLQLLGAMVEAARAQMRSSLRDLLVPLMGIWETEFDQSQRDPSLWRYHMKICRVAISAAASALWTVDCVQLNSDNDNNINTNGTTTNGTTTNGTSNDNSNHRRLDEVGQVLVGACSMAARIADVVFAAQVPAEDTREAVSKMWERLLMVGIVGLTKHTSKFAASMPSWVDLCVQRGIKGVEWATVHTLRNKTRVLSIRLLARMLLHPHLRRSHLEVSRSRLPDPMLAFSRGIGASAADAARDDPAMQNAVQSLEDLLSVENGSCMELVENVASKYIMLTPDEKLEWEGDPEGFAREVDLETSPDADTPRPCGIGLLECMLEYSPDNVKQTIMSLAQVVAQNSATSDDVITAREAVYRIVGECFPHLKFVISFDQWYTSELKGIIAGTESALAGMSGFARSMLTSRCIWLIGVCSEEMSVMPFVEAVGLCTDKIKDPDLVVALMAVSAVGAMLTQVIEEQEFTLQPQRTRLLMLEGPVAISEEEDNIVKQAELEFKMHMDAVLSSLDAMVSNCFELLPKLAEVESMVRVVQCVTSAVELVGEKISSHFESFTRCIPTLWSMITSANDASGRQDRMALVRLQCSILAMLGHLVSKLGRAAVSSPAIAQVIYPLLLSSTDPRNAAAEPLAEDALRLWLSMLHASPELTTDLADLGPSRLVPHLERGKELEFCLRIAAAYALHGGLNCVTPMLDHLAARIDQVVVGVVRSLQEGPDSQTRTPASALQSVTLISPQAARELDAALTLLGILQRLYNPSELPTALERPIKSVCSLLCMDFRRGNRPSASNASFIPGRLAHLLHPALQIVTRLLYSSPSAIGPLTDFDRNAQVRLLDRWVTLGSSQDIGEVFVPQMSALGRSRRHGLAVAMCAMILKDECELLRDGPRAARCLIMALKAAFEQSVFEKEQEMLFMTEAKNDEGHPQDFLREKRLSMKRADPLRNVNAEDALRQAANHVMSYLGRDGLLSLMETYNPVFSAEMAKIVSSSLSEADAEAALRALEAAHIS